MLTIEANAGWHGKLGEAPVVVWFQIYTGYTLL
jgi:hypothetical protein